MPFIAKDFDAEWFEAVDESVEPVDKCNQFEARETQQRFEDGGRSAAATAVWTVPVAKFQFQFSNFC